MNVVRARRRESLPRGGRDVSRPRRVARGLPRTARPHRPSSPPRRPDQRQGCRRARRDGVAGAGVDASVGDQLTDRPLARSNPAIMPGEQALAARRDVAGPAVTVMACPSRSPPAAGLALQDNRRSGAPPDSGGRTAKIPPQQSSMRVENGDMTTTSRSEVTLLPTPPSRTRHRRPRARPL